MLDLSIIIVSYNTKEFLKKCLESIANNVSQSLKREIIVVDNASSDESVESIKYYVSSIKYRNIRIIANKENVGFSRANNQGIKASKDSRYILFLNPDTIVKKNTLEEMINFMDKHKDAGAVSCKVVLPNGQIDDSCHRGFPTPWNAFSYFSGIYKIFPHSKLFSGYSLGFMDFSKTHEVDACAGAFMMVRREAGEEVEWWDEDYFWYGEDLDFCYRLKEKGWKIYYVPTVSILHYKGVSGGIKRESEKISTATIETKISATRHRFNAMKIFYKKHYEQKYPKLLRWLVLKTIDIKQSLALKNV